MMKMVVMSVLVIGIERRLVVLVVGMSLVELVVVILNVVVAVVVGRYVLTGRMRLVLRIGHVADQADFLLLDRLVMAERRLEVGQMRKVRVKPILKRRNRSIAVSYHQYQHHQQQQV